MALIILEKRTPRSAEAAADLSTWLVGQAFFRDIDISSWALQVLRNCVAIWPALQGIWPKERSADVRVLQAAASPPLRCSR